VPAVIDLTGRRFDALTVLERSSRRSSDGVRWRCICDCGKTCERTGYYLKTERPKCGHNCGCKKRREIKDLTGQRFGLLKVLRATDNRASGHIKWLCFCDCGQTCEKRSSYLKSESLTGAKCGRDCPAKKRHQRRLKYPPMPVDPPIEIGELFARYLPIIRSPKVNDFELEDFQQDRLLRVCWILHWRRQQGEEITDLHEQQYVRKALRNGRFEIFKRRRYNKNDNPIGAVMTDVTLPEKPVIETQAESSSVRRKRLSFQRC